MLALAVQKFFSAATDIVVTFVLIRGFVARSSGVIGRLLGGHHAHHRLAAAVNPVAGFCRGTGLAYVSLVQPVQPNTQ